MTTPHEMNFCPRCGNPLTDGERFGKTHRVCEACGFIHFRDPKVAAVVFVTQGARVLLVKRRMNPEQGKWALPAGFIDYGEDPKEAAVREVKEETGLDVMITGLVDVLHATPSGGLGATIVILYTGAVTGGVLRAQDDVAEAVFFAPDEIPLDAIAFESTRLQLERWQAEWARDE